MFLYAATLIKLDKILNHIRIIRSYKLYQSILYDLIFLIWFKILSKITWVAINGIYSLFGSEMYNIKYQIGLRAEHTYRLIQLTKTNEDFKIDRIDYFPTLHCSYKLSKKQQIMASYTRRINRPRGYVYEPFITWIDAYNVRKGNPQLLPEYIDAIELNFQQEFGKNAFTTEIFYRVTNNKIENVRIPYSETVMLQTYENAGKDYSFGTEFVLNLTPYKWLLIDINSDFYYYKIVGQLFETKYENGKYNWSSGITNTFKIKKNTRIQLVANYKSPSIWAQGRLQNNYFINLAIKQTLLDKSLNLTIQAKDILATAKEELIFEDTNFYTHSLTERKTPILAISLSWKFNNYKTKQAFDNKVDNDPF